MRRVAGGQSGKSARQWTQGQWTQGQLELTDRSTLTEGQDFRVFADQTWRLGDLGAKHALLLAGIGWGNMPAAMVRADLQSGRLVRLDLPDWRGGTFTMHLLHAAGARRVLPGDG